MIYDELDATGAVVRSAITLGPYDSLPDGHQWVPHAVGLDEARAAMRSQIETWRDAACEANVAVPVGGVAYQWQADARSQQLLGTAVSLSAAGAIPAPAVWRSATNVDVTVTLADLKTIAATIAWQTNQAYGHSWALKAALDAATTPEAIAAIVW